MVTIIAVQIMAATRARSDSPPPLNELEENTHSGCRRGMEERTSFSLA